MAMNITKARAAKARRDIEKLAIQNRNELNRAITYGESAKGGDYSALVPLIKALKASQQALKDADKALDKIEERKGWS